MSKKRSKKKKSSDDCSDLKKQCRDLKKQLTDLKKQLVDSEKEIKGLNKELEKKQKRIEQLEAQLKASKRQAGRFSRRNPKKKPKKPGRKKGHKGSFRPIPDHVDQSLHVPIDSCPDCGSTLEEIEDHVQYVEDIPPVRPVVKAYHTQSGWCPKCKKRHRSRHQDQISDATGSAGTVIGPRAVAFASELKHRTGIPFRKISRIFRDILGLQVSAGGLCQAVGRLAAKAESTYDLIIQQAQNSAVIHADETGWLIGGKSAWLWVFTNAELTVYAIRYSRAHGVIEEILGVKFNGVLVSDFFAAYNPIDCDKAKCMAHLLNTLSEMERSKTGIGARFARKACQIIRDAIELKRKKETMSYVSYQKKVQQIETRLDLLLQGNYTEPDNRRLANRMRKHRQALFTFLYDDQVAPTNNHAERQIRPAVIIRKISAGNRTDCGAKTHEILASLIETCCQQNKPFVTVVREILIRYDQPKPFPIFEPPFSGNARAPCRILDAALDHCFPWDFHQFLLDRMRQISI